MRQSPFSSRKRHPRTISDRTVFLNLLSRVGFLYTIRRNALERRYALGASHNAEGAAEPVMPVSK